MATQQPQPSSSAMAQESSTNYVDTPILLSYKIPFPVRLRSAIFSVAHFFRIMSTDTRQILTPEFSGIGSGHRSVDNYRDSLLYIYTRPKMQGLDFDHWTMDELRTYKDKKTTVKHEYLIATFTDGGNGRVHLRMERRIQDSRLKNFFQRGSGKKPAVLTDSDEGEQQGGGPRPDDYDRTTFKKWANDDVSLYPDNRLVQDNENGRLPVDHIRFAQGKRLNLPQMVLLACAIRANSTTYHLTQNNCYWFCYTAAEALKARFPDSHSVPVQGRSQQGTWLGLPTNMLVKDVNIGELLTRTDAMYTAFKKEIHETINNPDNEHTREARKNVEKEKKRADEAERRIEEEKRHVEEEKKRAAEEKKRAEEEKKRAEDAERRIAELEAKLAGQAKAT